MALDNTNTDATTAAGIDTSGVANNATAGTDLEAQAQQAAEQRMIEEQAEAATPFSNQLRQQQQQQGATGVTNQDIFPGLQDPILKGTSSSKTLGSQPIFVGSGGYLPLNLLYKKEAAMEQAAANRLKRQSKFKPGKVPELSNKKYQSDLDNSYAEMQERFMKEAQSVYGNNWDIALSSSGTDLGRRYAQSKRNFETMAAQGNEIFKRVSQVSASQQAGGETIYSPETIKLAREVENALQDFSSGKVADVLDVSDKLYGSYDLDHYLKENDVIGNIKADVTAKRQLKGGILEIDEWENYDAQIDKMTEELTQEGARYFGDNIITKEVIKGRLQAYLGVGPKKTKTEGKFQPQATTFTGKQKIKQSLIQDRYDSITAGRNNPRSDRAQQTVKNLRNKRYAGGRVTESGYVFPEDFDTAKDISQDFQNFYNSAGKKGGWFSKSEFDEKAKKTLVDAFSKKLGVNVGGKIKGVKIGEKEGDVVFTDMRGKENVYNMNNNDDLLNLEDFIIEASGLDPNFKDKTSVRLKVLDDKTGLERFEYLDTQAPEFYAGMNEMLNVDVGEGNKVPQGELNKLIGFDKFGRALNVDGTPKDENEQEEQETTPPTGEQGSDFMNQKKTEAEAAKEEKKVNKEQKGETLEEYIERRFDSLKAANRNKTEKEIKDKLTELYNAK